MTNLYQVGDRLIDLNKVSYIEKLADNRVWLIIDGVPRSIDAPHGDLIFGLMENRVSKSIKGVNVQWAIALHTDDGEYEESLINDVGILEHGCRVPMLFGNQIDATEWIYRQGIQASLKVIRWESKKQLVAR
jgi:hypothetical protein